MSINRKTVVVGDNQTNCYILSDSETKRALIVDPGDDAEKILGYLEKNGLTAEAQLLTHGHFDHIGAVQEIKKRTNAPVFAPFSEEMLLKTPEYNLSKRFCEKALVIEPDRVLSDGEKAEFSFLTFEVILTPGHTSGSSCYYTESEKMLFSGDTLFYHSYGRTDFPTGNMRELYRSVTEKLLMLPEDTQVFPGHGFPTTIKEEKKLWRKDNI